MLWQPKEEAYVPASSYGCTVEEWAALRVLALSRLRLTDVLERLGDTDIVKASTAGSNIDLPMQGGVTISLFMALRRARAIVGIQCVGYRGRPDRLAPQHDLIASGIAHLASLALENARLMEELAGVNRLKSDFMSTMSHELRTPLNIIMGYNTLLLDEAFGPLVAEQVDTLQRTQHSARQLLELIDATLDIGRLEVGRVPLDLADVDLPALMLEIQGEVGIVNHKPSVAVRWEVAASVPSIRTDALKVKVVLKNLLSNALKFTEDGQVTVVVHRRDGGVDMAVADTGVGIAPDVLPIMFEPFRQGERSLTRRYGGVGLGLYIVRRLLDLLGGTIAVQSEVGRGATFRVWIPSHPQESR